MNKPHALLTVLQSSGVASVIPSGDAGLFAWFDFSDITTLFQDTARSSAVTADGQNIKGVADKSGVGSHLATVSAATGITYETGIQNGLSVARGGGTTGFVSGTVNHGIGTGDFWVMAAFVRRDTGTTGGRAIASFGTYAPAWYIHENSVAAHGLYWGGSTAFSTTFANNGDYLEEFGREGGTVKTLVNGVQETPTAAIATSIANGTIQLFCERATGSSLAVMDLCEIAFYKPKPPDAFLALLRSYFNTKWALY